MALGPSKVLKKQCTQHADEAFARSAAAWANTIMQQPQCEATAPHFIIVSSIVSKQSAYRCNWKNTHAGPRFQHNDQCLRPHKALPLV